MPEYTHSSAMPVPPQALHDWHLRPGALERLIPPWHDVRVLERVGGVADGGTVLLAIKVGPARFRWLARHEGWQPGRAFADEQVEGPFAKWRHTHRFSPLDGERSMLEDHVHFRAPAGGLGHRLITPRVLGELARLFAWRHERTRRDLARHAAAALPPQRIVVSGASGTVGEALCAFLSTGGHRVERLVRRPAGAGEIRWDPAAGTIDRAALEGVDAVIHLAGETVAQRWTPAALRRILDSRRQGTRLLAEALAGLARKPRVFVSASAVGYYGDRGDEALDEQDRTAGSGFLAEVCQAWELASFPAREAGIRTVNLRLGVVLTPGGGALAQMLPAFRLGLGGPIGSGRQWLSWVALDDVLGAVLHALGTEALAGPVNLTSPQPVTSAELARTLGDVLGRPAVLSVPGPAVLALFGDMGKEMLLGGQRVIPARLLETGFRFGTPLLGEALRWEIGLTPGAGA